MRGIVSAYETLFPSSSEISGSGTIGYLPVFNSTNSITDSIVNQSANASDPSRTDLNVAGNLVVSPTASSSGAVTNFKYNGTSNLTQTASTEIHGVYWDLGSRQWQAGAITNQREFYLSSPTYSFTSSSVITNAYTFYAVAPTAGLNASITNSFAAGFAGDIEITYNNQPSYLQKYTSGGVAYDALRVVSTAVGGAPFGVQNLDATGFSGIEYYDNSSSLAVFTGFYNGNGKEFRFNNVAFEGYFDWQLASTSVFKIDSSQIAYTLSTPTISNQSPSTEFPQFKISGNSKQWQTGAITTQRWNYLTANTASFVGASTITDSYGLYVEAAIAGTNATITNNYAAGFAGDVNVIGNVYLSALFTPLIVGGTAAGSNITYKSTTGTGTTTAAAHTFTGGTNGGTTIATLYNNGNVNIGNYASPNNLRLVTIGQDTGYVSIGSLVGATNYGAIYIDQASPSVSNYSLASDGTNLFLNAPTGGSVVIRNNNSVVNTINGLTTSGANTTFTVAIPANTGQTASTEISNFKVNGASKTWAAGAITTQRWNYLTANTAAFASASTITDSYGLYVEAAIAGSNATITNNWALGLSGGIEATIGTGTFRVTNLSGSTTQSAIYMNNTTAIGTTNYVITSTNSTATFNGRTNMSLAAGGTSYLNLNPAASNVMWSFSNANKTGNTASTELNQFKVTGSSLTWAAGAITTQRWNYLTANTAAFASASTITDSYGLYVEAATAGSNATITNNYALGLAGGKLGIAASTTSYASWNMPSGTAPSSPVDGDVWYDSTQKALVSYRDNIKQYDSTSIFSQTQAVTVANTIVETALTGTGVGTLTLPANFFVSGKTIKITGFGIHSATSNPNITITVKFGSTTIVTTGAVTSANSTNSSFRIHALITCYTTGATGTVWGQGIYTEAGAGANTFSMANTAATTINTTASQAISITVTWGTASASNTITMSNLNIEVIE